MSNQWLFWIVVTVCWASGMVCSVPANDVVQLRQDGSDETTTRRGTIVEWNGEKLELETSSGRIVRFPNQDVVQIEVERLETQTRADQLASQQSYEEALALYRSALSEESRRWMRRELLARIVSIERLASENQAACRDFLRLYRDQPVHRHWAIAPLPWRAEQPDGGLEQLAVAWLDSSDPLEQLLGACWLLVSSRRTAATGVLNELSRNDRGPIGQLATAQLWRLSRELSSAQLKERAEITRQFPLSLRAGPHYLMGRALQANERYDEAAMQFLRVRIVHEESLDLGVLSLYEAGRVLEQAGRSQEAAQVLEELVTHFPDTIWAQEVENR